jgi:molybdenum cofactor cytidylyltransferase
MIPAVILAAGASRRLGRPKQLVWYEGETLLARAVKAACACDPVIVVTGCQAGAMARELVPFPVHRVFNGAWEEGMASSIRAGVRALPPGSAGALFLVCDQPAVDRNLVDRLLAAWSGVPVACVYAGVRGIPAILPAASFPALLELKGDRGARSLLGGAEVLEVPFPEGAWDIDEPGDL